MYAIVEISGISYQVSPDQLFYVKYIGNSYKEGEEIIFNSIFFIDKTLKDKVQVKAKIIAHIKNNKITIFKKKRRKGYQVKRGHRQIISIIKIISID